MTRKINQDMIDELKVLARIDDFDEYKREKDSFPVKTLLLCAK